MFYTNVTLTAIKQANLGFILSVMAEYMREQRCSLGVMHRTEVRPLQVGEETEDGSDIDNPDSINDFDAEGR